MKFDEGSSSTRTLSASEGVRRRRGRGRSALQYVRLKSHIIGTQTHVSLAMLALAPAARRLARRRPHASAWQTGALRRGDPCQASPKSRFATHLRHHPHPDAGKTTLTEKLLLYTGTIQAAGSVKGKSSAKHAVSDWMEIEKQRGISVTSSVLQFTYDGCCVNILDTPGHQDFSEDTYRTLMAADAAVMVIDGAKGVEAQTVKLFRVCALRGIPIFTFVNKATARRATRSTSWTRLKRCSASRPTP